MPNLWDKVPEAPSRSELNPLTNPLLEQNLGRWAKVYFSNPPAKRDEAVSHLLEEIKRESGAGPAQPDRPYFATDTKFQRMVCSACQHHNPPGHKFCSRCGQALSPGQPGSTGNLGSTENLGATRIPEPIPRPFDNDIPWLRHPVSSALDDSDATRGRGWKYLVGAAAIVLATFGYLQWAPGFLTKVLSTTTAPQPGAPAISRENSSPAEAKAPVATIVPESKGSQAREPSANREVHDRTVAVAPAGLEPAVQKSSLLNPTTSRQPVPDQESSAPDLRLAQRYLAGSMGVRDPSEAAKLLWKAVSKQNATAALLLSDLYLRGDGVPKSCDQARLLLVAAAKRGSPQAAQQLRNLESQGCR